MIPSKFLSRLALTAAMIAVPGLLSAGLVHDYQFQGDLNDSLGGPALTSLGGTVGASGYTFALDKGLSLSNGLTAGDVYTIAMQFSLDEVSGYRKILDYKNLTTDNGVYTLNGDVNFYNTSFSAGGEIPAGTLVDVVVTRDASGNFVGYVNGVQRIAFTDSGALATFVAPDFNMIFFVDDVVTGQLEASGGSVDRIQVYDNALSAREVAALDLSSTTSTTAAPEPGSVVLFASAAAGVLLLRRKF